MQCDYKSTSKISKISKINIVTRYKKKIIKSLKIFLRVKKINLKFFSD